MIYLNIDRKMTSSINDVDLYYDGAFLALMYK